MKVVIVSGGFDPLHEGHINYLQEANALGDVLIVALNSDEWLIRKKGNFFLNFEQRNAIIKSLTVVNSVINFDDSDNTAIDAINKVKNLFIFDNKLKIIFANGGDRVEDNVPEIEYFKQDNSVEFMFEVGGANKINSSSAILSNWHEVPVVRQWGTWSVLKSYKDNKTKVKELTVAPGKSLSMQKHSGRNELWFVISGQGHILDETNNSRDLNTNAFITIPKNSWHKLVNSNTENLEILEIQYGDYCIEEDIKRV